MSSIVTLDDPEVPKLVPLDEDPAPERKSLGDPATLVPPSRWITDPNASVKTIHIATPRADGKPDLSKLRGRVLLVIEIGKEKHALILHPEVAMGWAQGISAAVQGAMEAPPAPRSPDPTPTDPPPKVAA